LRLPMTLRAVSSHRAPAPTHLTATILRKVIFYVGLCCCEKEY
jgi:hypothetical protein